MRKYRIGTSGWQYDHWRSRFYPRGLAKQEWLSYYTSAFSCVEINYSYYRQPKDHTWDGWRQAAPRGFRFAVKANRFLTHMKRFKDSEESLKRFIAGAERLKNYLGPVLFQAPPDFECNDETLRRLDDFARYLPRRLSYAFEFRHDSWFKSDAGLDLLRRHRIAHCIQDMPGLNCPIVTTAKHAYVRLHGAGQPYAGRYSDEALRNWAEQLRRLEDADVIWVFFNNDLQGNAVDNARELFKLLVGSA